MAEQDRRLEDARHKTKRASRGSVASTLIQDHPGLASARKSPTLSAVNDAFPVSPPRAWAEVDLAALRKNLGVARALAGVELMAVVKAGAYGHGMEEVAIALAEEDLVFFGVANVGEARRIRHAGVTTRIYLLGATWAGEREEIVAHGWTPCLLSLIHI